MDEYLTDYAERFKDALYTVEDLAPCDFTLDDIDYFTADLMTIRMLPEPQPPITPGGLLDH